MYVRKPFVKEEQFISSADRRTIKRRHLIYYMRVWDTLNNRLLGHLADVSEDGIMLVGEAEIPADRNFELEIRLPAALDAMEVVHFKAISRWSSNDANKLFFDTGLQFTEISEETLKRLTNLIEEYGFND